MEGWKGRKEQKNEKLQKGRNVEVVYREEGEENENEVTRENVEKNPFVRKESREGIKVLGQEESKHIRGYKKKCEIKKIWRTND